MTHAKNRGYIDNYNPQAKTQRILEQVEVVLDEEETWPTKGKRGSL